MSSNFAGCSFLDVLAASLLYRPLNVGVPRARFLVLTLATLLIQSNASNTRQSHKKSWENITLLENWGGVWARMKEPDHIWLSFMSAEKIVPFLASSSHVLRKDKVLMSNASGFK